jgi:hypothetical protein
VYDFYNYEMESTLFVQLFFKFSQVCRLATCPFKSFCCKVVDWLLSSATWPPFILLSELGIYWCTAFLPGNEELYSKKALQGKDNKDQDKLKSSIVAELALMLLMLAYYTTVDVPLLLSWCW